MGKKLDVLLGRKFRTSKLKITLNHANSRLTLLKNHRLSKFNIARSDVIQLLRLNHHQQALLRVEQVIKDQSMLDVYDMIHGYCHLLIQKTNLIEQVNDCPGELKEAVSDMLYAAPRCGEFPELQEIRAILTNRFGKEFANGSIQLHKNCGVSQKMIQKLSPQQPSLESRMNMLTRIANENGIIWKLEKLSPEITEEKVEEKIENDLSMDDSINEMTDNKDAEESKQMKIAEFDSSNSDLYSEGSSDEEDIRSFHEVHSKPFEKKMFFDESDYKIVTEQKAFQAKNFGRKSVY